jgi:hypothetical protein
MKFPNGCLVENNQQVYKVLDGWLYPMLSWRAVCSWGQPVIHAEYIYDYEVSESRVGFRPCSIIESVIDGKAFYIEGMKKRLITTPDFWELGFNPYENIIVSQEELDFHKNGQDIA